MTAAQTQILSHLAADHRFVEAVEAIATEEISELVRALRNHVANGQHRDAGIAEGKIQAFESLADVFTRDRGYARPPTVSP